MFDEKHKPVVWLSCSFGYEQKVLALLREKLSTNFRVVGGTPADNKLEGRWRMCMDTGEKEDLSEESFDTGFIITVLDPTVGMSVKFVNSYKPVLSCQGRE